MAHPRIRRGSLAKDTGCALSKVYGPCRNLRPDLHPAIPKVHRLESGIPFPPSTYLSIRDDAGSDMPASAGGRRDLRKGPQVMAGYWKQCPRDR